jgi:hypothetical protein
VAVNSTDLDAVAFALKTIISAVSGAGQVERGKGAAIAWYPDGGTQTAFWEIYRGTYAETPGGAGPLSRQETVFHIDGYLPLKREANTPTRFDDLIRSVGNALRNNPCLKVEAVATVQNSWHALTQNDVVWIEPGDEKPRVRSHMCQFQVFVSELNTYSPT